MGLHLVLSILEVPLEDEFGDELIFWLFPLALLLPGGILFTIGRCVIASFSLGSLLPIFYTNYFKLR